MIFKSVENYEYDKSYIFSHCLNHSLSKTLTSLKWTIKEVGLIHEVVGLLKLYSDFLRIEHCRHTNLITSVYINNF